MVIVNTPIGYVAVKINANGYCVALNLLGNAHPHRQRIMHAVDDLSASEAGGATNAIAQRGEQICAEIRSYFSGALRQFSVPLHVEGSPFARRVWTGIANIGYGERRSYGELAASVGAPRAVRAVASAVASNPLPLLIPCHRVVRKNGTIGEYALRTLGTSGREIKRYLLELELRTAASKSSCV